MGIQQDADTILEFIYEQYINDSQTVNPRKLLDKFKPKGWDGKRIDRSRAQFPVEARRPFRPRPKP